MTKKTNAEAVSPTSKDRLTREAEGTAGGAVAGAAMGALAGPPGVAVGAVLGAVAGALAGAALGKEAAERSEEDELLDAEIGVTEGDIGAPNLAHPPAKRAAVSAAVAGSGGSDGAGTSEGPLPAPPD